MGVMWLAAVSGDLKGRAITSAGGGGGGGGGEEGEEGRKGKEGKEKKGKDEARMRTTGGQGKRG